MKKRTKLILIISMLAIVSAMSIGTFIFKNITMSPVMYSNNISLTPIENKEIKTLVLDAVKERFSYGLVISETLDSSKEAAIEVPSKAQDTSSVIIIDEDFMKTAEKTEFDEYLLVVKMYYPVDYSCHITVENINGEYTITEFSIDP